MPASSARKRTGRRKKAPEGVFRFRFAGVLATAALDAGGTACVRLESPSGRVFEVRETARRLHFSKGTAKGVVGDVVRIMAEAAADPAAFRNRDGLAPDVRERFLAAVGAFGPMASRAAHLIEEHRPWARSGPKEWSPRVIREAE